MISTDFIKNLPWRPENQCEIKPYGSLAGMAEASGRPFQKVRDWPRRDGDAKRTASVRSEYLRLYQGRPLPSFVFPTAARRDTPQAVGSKSAAHPTRGIGHGFLLRGQELEHKRRRFLFLRGRHRQHDRMVEGNLQLRLDIDDFGLEGHRRQRRPFGVRRFGPAE